ncbi:hypothetical protein [Streptosporangium sp. 'caverna']
MPSMVVLSIYRRRRCFPESKPVGAPHRPPDVEGGPGRGLRLFIAER